MMDTVRYFLALIILVSFPAAMSMWLVIHPLARFWRRRGPAVTYLAVVAVAGASAVVFFRLRGALLQIEYGFRWPLTAVGIACLLGATWIEHRYRRQIDVATLLGLPELSRKRPSRLLTEGIYGRIRHPRYVGILLEVSAFAFFVNYLAVYVLVVAVIPMIYLIVLLEERELAQRFGEEYERYRRDVPRFVPKLGDRYRTP